MATIINDPNYSSLIKQTLTDEWSQYRQPLRINDNADLTAGMTLFAKIAAEAVVTSGSAEKSESSSLSASHKVSSSTASLDETADKIKAFVKDKAYVFGKVCETGFPFSVFNGTSTEIALKRALERCDSILFYFMTCEDSWPSERELNKRFGKPFQRLQASEVAEACSNLARAYIRDKNSKAGYYLLWLIKQIAGCNYKIPKQSSFNDTTVAKVLSKSFARTVSVRNAANFVEILHFRSCRLDKSLYQEFLDRGSSLIFLKFALQQLVEIPMDKWPNKAYIITRLFETASSESKLTIATYLSSSKDAITSAVGNHFLKALTASTLRESVPHFNALEKLLPNFNYTHVEIIFGRPLVEFCRNSFYEDEPKFVKLLNFNVPKGVFIHGSLMMGVYSTGVTYGGKRVPPHLLAYDMNTEKMVWGIPLTPISLEAPALNTSAIPTTSLQGMGRVEYSLKKVGELISLRFLGEKKVHFIRPETGEFNYTLELPEPLTDKFDRLHISPMGFGYQMVHNGQKRTLIGGKIINYQWNTSFTHDARSGIFYPFSTHCGFQQDFEDKLVLFGPTGDQITIEGCIRAKAQDDKLYSIEKDPVNKDKCLLRVRTLKVDNEVVSGIEKSIPLNLKKASFGKICQNGQIILFDDGPSGKSPVFVSLDSQEVTPISHTIPGYETYVINTDSGELWTWDQLSREVWKISSDKKTLMGKMWGNRSTTFVYADKADRLYRTDIPF